MRSRVEVFEEIRRDHRLEGLSIRQLVERHKVHRRAVRQALGAAVRALSAGFRGAFGSGRGEQR